MHFTGQYDRNQISFVIFAEIVKVLDQKKVFDKTIAA